MKDSIADVICALLQAQGFANSTDAKLPWPVYSGFLPDTAGVADDALCVYNTAPLLQGRVMTDGTVIERLGIQIKARSLLRPDGWSKLDAIKLALRAVYHAQVTLNDVTYILDNISCGGVLALGVELGTTKRRSVHTLNALVTVHLAS